MAHYKLIKSKTFCRLIPTLMFTIAITSIVLTVFFMFVLQSRNAYELDSDEFSIDNDDFIMEINGATADQIANLDIEDIIMEEDDIFNVFTTPPPSSSSPPPPPPQYESFLLKKPITTTTNNHIKMNNNNLRNMKAYKIISKEPIIGNSLVKIVMAPHNVLEKLSNQDNGNNNVKYAIDEINKNYGNAPAQFDRESIQNINSNVNVEVFSLESEEKNAGVMGNNQPKGNLPHRDLNNIQVIVKSRKQPLNMISIDRKIPFDLMALKEGVGNNGNSKRHENEAAHELQSIELEMKSEEVVPGMEAGSDTPTSLVHVEPTPTLLPTTTQGNVIDSTFTEAEELLSNPTTSLNLVPTLIPEDVKSDMSTEVKMETKNENNGWSDEDLALPDVSKEDNVPLVVLRVLKNRTVLVEETRTQSTPDQLSMETISIPTMNQPPIIKPKKITRPTTTTTTTEVPMTKVKPFPKKGDMVDPNLKYENSGAKLDDVSFDSFESFESMELGTETSLLDIETTRDPSLADSAAKSKNTKRAIGDEGKFASNIVRPSPIRSKGIADLFPRETDAERTDRLSKSMQRMMHFMTIFGHVDSYLTKRLRTGLKNVARILDSAEDTRRRRSNL